jgi:alanyl-tRNA synthetase
MTSKEIRQQFLDFFKSKDHTIVDSAPVVPLDDPTLMFTNAGMNQFKDVFLGTGSRAYKRVADTQKCIRAGGKHNDLDDVGQDAYHHTFFEMLGNWSFGDYFKKEAIEWAWELLTEVWGIDKTRLHATYFEGDEAEGLEPDEEAAQLWRSVTDINPANIHPGNKKDNFWEMGDTGPCGPCSEIHIDLTPDKSGARLVNAGDPRVIELWNLVFIQFNRAVDGTLTPLPAKHVDTGMGFERLCAVLNGKDSNYDTDVWTPLFAAIQKRTEAPDYKGTLPGDATEPNRDRKEAGDSAPSRTATVRERAQETTHQQVMVDVSYRIIADHVRCLTFALTDGAIPSNEGRGYVLRRILRRGIRFGRQYFNMREPFMCDLVEPLVDLMADVFPELRTAHGGDNVKHVTDLIREEEESFGNTLDRGIRLFAEAADHALRRHHGRISGEDAFKLHDTYGFPIDLTELMAEERNLKVDIGEYERLMAEARKRARAVCGESTEIEFAVKGSLPECDSSHKYRTNELETTILGWVCDCEWVKEGRLTADEPKRAGLVFPETCAYPEQGGQAGDEGEIRTDTGVFELQTTQLCGESVVHIGSVTKGYIRTGQKATIRIDPKRSSTMQNHTATHILNWALREVLGAQVQQKGSLVDPEKTRFDFSCNRQPSVEELTRVEELCNKYIQADRPLNVQEVEKDKALQINTLRAVFGEQYPDKVRVISIGADIDAMGENPQGDEWMKYSVEFCGGTHCKSSGEVERFVLISEEGVAKGIRRVVGISGAAARQAEADGAALLDELESLSEVPPAKLAEKISAFQQKATDAVIPIRVRHALRERMTELQRRVKKQEKAAASDAAGEVMERVASILAGAETVSGVTIVAGEVPAAPADALRGAIDWVRNKTDASAVLLACAADKKVTLVSGMSKAVVAKGVKAGDLIKEVAPLVGGKGGGRPDMAQGGGNDPAGIANAVERAKAWIAERLT